MMFRCWEKLRRFRRGGASITGDIGLLGISLVTVLALNLQSDFCMLNLELQANTAAAFSIHLFLIFPLFPRLSVNCPFFQLRNARTKLYFLQVSTLHKYNFLIFYYGVYFGLLKFGSSRGIRRFASDGTVEKSDWERTFLMYF